MVNNSADNRGTITQNGSILQVENALVEEVVTTGRNAGHIIISYAVPRRNGGTSIELFRLNVSSNTIILNSLGLPTNLSEIRKGMWIDARFSPLITRSNPPQSNAFLIRVRRQVQPPASSVTTDRVASVDVVNGFLYTGDPRNINRQTRFVVTNSTAILDRNGNPISLWAIRPGQMVRITHANFQTASIPPQTTAFSIQLV